MAITEGKYRISFSSKDVKRFNEIFAMVLQNLKLDEELPNFKVSYNKERIIIQIPACLESFSFIAQIIQEIDDFEMSLNKTNVGDTALKRAKLNDKNEENDTQKETEPSAM